jgi:2-iminobutanoate/2-iminopropanoate deaminase
LEHVVKTTCFLTDLDRFGAFNERYAAAFTLEPQPARSTVQVARLPMDAAVEIEAWAYRRHR